MHAWARCSGTWIVQSVGDGVGYDLTSLDVSREGELHYFKGPECGDGSLRQDILAEGGKNH